MRARLSRLITVNDSESNVERVGVRPTVVSARRPAVPAVSKTLTDCRAGKMKRKENGLVRYRPKASEPANCTVMPPRQIDYRTRCRGDRSAYICSRESPRNTIICLYLKSRGCSRLFCTLLNVIVTSPTAPSLGGDS